MILKNNKLRVDRTYSCITKNIILDFVVSVSLSCNDGTGKKNLIITDDHVRLACTASICKTHLSDRLKSIAHVSSSPLDFLLSASKLGPC